MRAADLTEAHVGHLVAWTRNGTRHSSRPVSIEHHQGWCYLGHEGPLASAGYAHILRDEWDVEVKP